MEEASGKDSCLINWEYLWVINILSSFKLNKEECSELIAVLYCSKSLWSLQPLGVAKSGSWDMKKSCSFSPQK